MSQHHRAKGWANHAAKARQRIKAMLPLPCHHCAGIVTPDMDWDVAHIIDLSQGGDAKQYTAAHRSCNRRDGGRLGAKKTNEQKKNLRRW